MWFKNLILDIMLYLKYQVQIRAKIILHASLNKPYVNFLSLFISPLIVFL